MDKIQKMIKVICVCGAGTMGSGIAQVAAQSGYATILYDLDPSVLSKAKESIDKTLSQLVNKEKITVEDRKAISERLKFTSRLEDCRADVIIEAVVEKPGIKIDLFNRLADMNRADAIFASNTSSLSLNDIAARTRYPGRAIGMHFFNPAPLMKLVEIVKTDFTDKNVTDAVVELARSFGKTPVLCTDSPGFIVNRVARPFYIESLRLVEDGHADFSMIDELMVATGFKMGPFRLMDLIGNDVNYAVSCSVYRQLGQPARLRPSAIQEEKVKKGALGRKTGKGYYQYD